MGRRVIARCEGCKSEVVLAQESKTSSGYLSSTEFKAFLTQHEACHARVPKGSDFVTQRTVED
jgi:hypothetical protein